MDDHDELCPWNTEDWRGNSRRCECTLIERVAAREAKVWVRQVAEASQRVLDQREELEARVMMLRADQRRRWVDLQAKVEAMRDEAGLFARESDEENYEEATYEYLAQQQALERVLVLINRSGA